MRVAGDSRNLIPARKSAAILPAMNRHGLPRWLYFDPIAFLGMWISFWAFAPRMMEIAQRWASDRSSPPSAEEDRMLARLLACAEGWLEFAIARRAFRSAGLRVSNIAWRRATPPATRRAFHRRAKLYFDRFYALDAAARARTTRLKGTLAGPVAIRGFHGLAATATACLAEAAFTQAAVGSACTLGAWTRGIPAPP